MVRGIFGETLRVSVDYLVFELWSSGVVEGKNNRVEFT